jgi:hypothetical protein
MQCCSYRYRKRRNLARESGCSDRKAITIYNDGGGIKIKAYANPDDDEYVFALS